MIVPLRRGTIRYAVVAELADAHEMCIRDRQLTHIDLGEFHSDLAAPARRAVEPGGKIENGNVHTVIKWRIGY